MMDFLSIAHFINSILMISLPILLGIFLIRKFRAGWKVWLTGATAFVISQAFHIPFNLVVLNPWLEKILANWPGMPGFFILSILLGVSAATFETFARYAMYRWWLKQNRSWQMGILAGAGHGGSEAIILGGLALLAYLNMVAYRNVDLSMLNLAPDQLSLARLQVQSYWSVPWYGAMLGAVERIFTIPLHIAASVLVLQAFIRKPSNNVLLWIGLAFLLHFITDALVAFTTRWGIYVPEVILGILALIDISIIFLLRQPGPQNPQPLPLISSVLPTFTPAPIEETSENLEKTRYQ